MDLEMTGLDPTTHVIVEIATIITDDELTILAEGPDLVIHANDEEMAAMGEFVTAMHTKSGLLDKISSSTITRRDAEIETLTFLQNHIAEPATVPLAGNSIGTDRRFLQEYMPELERFLHYRNVDVSTVKELAQRWRPEILAKRPDKATTHRAMDDVRESIAELAFYRTHFMTPGDSDVPDDAEN